MICPCGQDLTAEGAVELKDGRWWCAACSAPVTHNPMDDPETKLERKFTNLDFASAADFMRAMGDFIRPVVEPLFTQIEAYPFAEADRLGLYVTTYGRRGEHAASVWASPSRRGVGVGATAGEAVRRAIEDLERGEEG